MEVVFNNYDNYAILNFSDEYIDEFDFNPSEIFNKIKQWANEKDFLITKVSWDNIPIHLINKGYYVVGLSYISKEKNDAICFKGIKYNGKINPKRFEMRKNTQISKRIERYKKYKEGLLNEGN